MEHSVQLSGEDGSKEDVNLSAQSPGAAQDVSEDGFSATSQETGELGQSQAQMASALSSISEGYGTHHAIETQGVKSDGFHWESTASADQANARLTEGEASSSLVAVSTSEGSAIGCTSGPQLLHNSREHASTRMIESTPNLSLSANFDAVAAGGYAQDISSSSGHLVPTSALVEDAAVGRDTFNTSMTLSEKEARVVSDSSTLSSSAIDSKSPKQRAKKLSGFSVSSKQSQALESFAQRIQRQSQAPISQRMYEELLKKSNDALSSLSVAYGAEEKISKEALKLVDSAKETVDAALNQLRTGSGDERNSVTEQTHDKSSGGEEENLDSVCRKAIDRSVETLEYFLGHRKDLLASLKIWQYFQNTFVDNEGEEEGKEESEETLEISRVMRSQSIGGVDAPPFVSESDHRPSTVGAVPLSLSFEELEGSRPQTAHVAGQELANEKSDPARGDRLQVLVMRGRNLCCKDDITQTSDPFVSVHFGEEIKNTRVVEKSLNPEWNESFTFSNVHDLSVPLRIVVEDQDILNTEFMGEAVVSLHSLKVNKPMSRWIRLTDMAGAQGQTQAQKSLGEILIKVYWECTRGARARPHSQQTSMRARGSGMDYWPGNSSMEEESNTKARANLSEEYPFVPDLVPVDEVASHLDPQSTLRLRETFRKFEAKHIQLRDAWRRDKKEIIALMESGGREGESPDVSVMLLECLKSMLLSLDDLVAESRMLQELLKEINRKIEKRKEQIAAATNRRKQKELQSPKKSPKRKKQFEKTVGDSVEDEEDVERRRKAKIEEEQLAEAAAIKKAQEEEEEKQRLSQQEEKERQAREEAELQRKLQEEREVEERRHFLLSEKEEEERRRQEREREEEEAKERARISREKEEREAKERADAEAALLAEEERARVQKEAKEREAEAEASQRKKEEEELKRKQEEEIEEERRRRAKIEQELLRRLELEEKVKEQEERERALCADEDNRMKDIVKVQKAAELKAEEELERIRQLQEAQQKAKREKEEQERLLRQQAAEAKRKREMDAMFLRQQQAEKRKKAEEDEKRRKKEALEQKERDELAAERRREEEAERAEFERKEKERRMEEERLQYLRQMEEARLKEEEARLKKEMEEAEKKRLQEEEERKEKERKAKEEEERAAQILKTARKASRDVTRRHTAYMKQQHAECLKGMSLRAKKNLSLEDEVKCYKSVWEAARKGSSTEAFKILLEQERYCCKHQENREFDINEIDRDSGERLLSIACWAGNANIAEYLVLDCHADIHLYDGPVNKITPLHDAARSGRREIVRFLIDVGANINAVDAGGDTALHWAVRKNHIGVVKDLLEPQPYYMNVPGMTPHWRMLGTKNYKGQLAFDLATKENIRDMLAEHVLLLAEKEKEEIMVTNAASKKVLPAISFSEYGKMTKLVGGSGIQGLKYNSNQHPEAPSLNDSPYSGSYQPRTSVFRYPMKPKNHRKGPWPKPRKIKQLFRDLQRTELVKALTTSLNPNGDDREDC